MFLLVGSISSAVNEAKNPNVRADEAATETNMVVVISDTISPEDICKRLEEVSLKQLTKLYKYPGYNSEGKKSARHKLPFHY